LPNAYCEIIINDDMVYKTYSRFAALSRASLLIASPLAAESNSIREQRNERVHVWTNAYGHFGTDSSMPFFEAGTEKFVRDWRDSVVRVVVRDSRCAS
jgi:hypothetical protein